MSNLLIKSVDNLSKYSVSVLSDSILSRYSVRLSTDLINKLDIAILGANIYVSGKQLASWCAANTEIDAKYLIKGIGKVNTLEMEVYSPQLYDRFKGRLNREMGELGNVGKTRQLFLHKPPSSAKWMVGIRAMDKLAVGEIWNAVIVEQTELNPEMERGQLLAEKVAPRAESIIRRTQPTFHPKDRSLTGRSRSVFTRIFTKYTSQRNKNVMILKRAALHYNRSNKTIGDKGKLIKAIFIVRLINALIMQGINEIRKGWAKRRRTTLDFAIDTLITTVVGNLYFLPEVVSSIKSKFKKGAYGGYDIGNPLTSFFNMTIDAVTEIGQTITQGISQEEYKSGAKKGELKWKTTGLEALSDTISTVGSLKGVPVDNMKKYLIGKKGEAGLYGLITGEGKELDITAPSGKYRVPTIRYKVPTNEYKIKKIRYKIPTTRYKIK